MERDTFLYLNGILRNIFVKSWEKFPIRNQVQEGLTPGKGSLSVQGGNKAQGGPNFHHQGVIMICDITSDSNTFDYFLEEALVKRSVEPAEIALLKTSPLNSLIGVKPVNNRAKQGK